MTKGKALPKIEKCVCGKDAECCCIVDSEQYRDGECWVVRCGKGECWSGPIKKTEHAAILAWNMIMWFVNDAKRLAKERRRAKAKRFAKRKEQDQ